MSSTMFARLLAPNLVSHWLRANNRLKTLFARLQTKAAPANMQRWLTEIATLTDESQQLLARLDTIEQTHQQQRRAQLLPRAHAQLDRDKLRKLQGTDSQTLAAMAACERAPNQSR